MIYDARCVRLHYIKQPYIAWPRTASYVCGAGTQQTAGEENEWEWRMARGTCAPAMYAYVVCVCRTTNCIHGAASQLVQTQYEEYRHQTNIRDWEFLQPAISLGEECRTYA